MRLDEQLEVLRGTPIPMFTGDPIDIPWLEVSDAKRLCKHPLVSVITTAYNHEPYIRQAIESIMMQVTDFEIELIVGEDASQDQTRAICFECQKRYPDRIRVLWAEVNVSKLGGNLYRCMAHARGKYLAFCEGDDYWIDVDKLQSQVRLMEDKRAIGCLAFHKGLLRDGSTVNDFRRIDHKLTNEFLISNYLHTSTFVCERSALLEALKYSTGIRCIYDYTMYQLIANLGKIVLLPQVVSVRRVTGEGAWTGLTNDQRIFFGIDLNLPLFCFGPPKYRHLYADEAMKFLVYFFARKPGQDTHECVKKHRWLIWRMFFKLLLWRPFRISAVKYFLMFFKYAVLGCKARAVR